MPEPAAQIDDPSASPARSATPDSVGRLQGEAWLEIHTHQAQRLIRGRNRKVNKPAITGLLGFASQLNIIWQAASEDDPYAHWWLIKIEEAMAEVQSYLTAQLDQMGGLCAGTARFQWSVSYSQRPHTVLLQFATPYAYRASQLLGEFDCLVCQCLTLKHVGAGEPGQLNAVIEAAAHQVRRVFSLPQGFKLFAIDRAAVRQRTQRAEQARAHFGELPADIFTGERTATFAPVRSPIEPQSFGPDALAEASPTETPSDSVETADPG